MVSSYYKVVAQSGKVVALIERGDEVAIYERNESAQEITKRVEPKFNTTNFSFPCYRIEKKAFDKIMQKDWAFPKEPEAPEDQESDGDNAETNAESAATEGADKTKNEKSDKNPDKKADEKADEKTGKKADKKDEKSSS